MKVGWLLNTGTLIDLCSKKKMVKVYESVGMGTIASDVGRSGVSIVIIYLKITLGHGLDPNCFTPAFCSPCIGVRWNDHPPEFSDPLDIARQKMLQCGGGASLCSKDLMAHTIPLGTHTHIMTFVINRHK